MRSWRTFALAAGALLATRCLVSLPDYAVGDLDATDASADGSGGAAGGVGGSSGVGGSAGASGAGGAAGTAASDGSAGMTATGTSCQTSGPGLTDCGHNQEDCCTSPLVTGGTFKRSYDKVTYTDQSHLATVSTFRLDRYEITVGRFRKFVAAWDAGWRPAQGDGKHAHLNGGSGLSESSTGNTYETGWDATWSGSLATTATGWDTNLSCNASYQTWTSSAASNERRPVGCVTLYEAYAFCIWDGGFLPSEAEWNYAAAGGSEQRAYPWSSPATSTLLDCAHANFTSCHGAANEVGSESATGGDGKWSQADLAGNVWEWTLDSSTPYAASCVDCAHTAPTSPHVIRGGAFDYVGSYLLASYRGVGTPSVRYYDTGARCARAP